MCPIYMQGIGQMTPAQQTTLRIAQGQRGPKRGRKTRASGSRKRAKKTMPTLTGSKKKSRVGKLAKRLVKGSAEAKRYMAKIRKLRKK